jgi:hypothetical protein
LLDRDGNDLVQYIPQFIKLDDHNNLISIINKLRATIPPFPPPSKWKRFNLSSNQDPKSSSISDSPGFYYYGVHHEVDHYTEPPVLSIHWAAKTYRSTAAGETFRSSTALTKLSTELSLIFHALDKDCWIAYRKAYKNIAESIVKLQTVDRCRIQAFMGVFVLVDLQTEPHVDLMDLHSITIYFFLSFFILFLNFHLELSLNHCPIYHALGKDGVAWMYFKSNPFNFSFFEFPTTAE